jgi:alkyl hydroperoxide reductase subunit AhpC
LRHVVVGSDRCSPTSSRKGAVARRYGVYREADGTAQRALVIIDAEGTVQWSYVSPVAVNPGVRVVLTALESISADAPTPYGVIA